MCMMVFEVQGKTDNYVQLAQDGQGVKFLGKLDTTRNRLRVLRNLSTVLYV